MSKTSQSKQSISNEGEIDKNAINESDNSSHVEQPILDNSPHQDEEYILEAESSLTPEQ